MLFLEYPPCTTCRKAKKWLDEKGFLYEDRNIKSEKPSFEELESWLKMSGLPVKKFFNTSGQLYRSLELKEKLPQMSEQEQLELLASDGMLVKRPIMVLDDKILIGFKQPEWEEALS